jgi:hypothetical protein
LEVGCGDVQPPLPNTTRNIKEPGVSDLTRCSAQWFHGSETTENRGSNPPLSAQSARISVIPMCLVNCAEVSRIPSPTSKNLTISSVAERAGAIARCGTTPGLTPVRVTKWKRRRIAPAPPNSTKPAYYWMMISARRLACSLTPSSVGTAFSDSPFQAVVIASAGIPPAISASRTASARRSDSFSL